MSEVELPERRMPALGREVEGDKLVTRHILEQTRRNGDDIAAMRTQLGRVEMPVGAVESDVRVVKAELRSLRSDCPRIVAESLRGVLRERDR